MTAVQKTESARSAAAEIPAAVSPPAAIAASAAGTTTALAPQSLADDAIVPADVPATLEEARRLLGVGQRDAARKMLQSWQSQHQGAAIPEDLGPLLDEAQSQ